MEKTIVSAKKKIYWLGLFPATICILGAILYILISSIIDMVPMIEENLIKFIFVLLLLVLDLVAVFGILIGGARDAIFQICYLFIKKKEFKIHEELLSKPLKETPRVVMLYCTCNDLDETALEISMKQNYPNYELVILDDSSKPEYLERVDAIAEKNNLRVLRRENRKGFKAGNLNNYLKSHQDEYEYVVVLDSDERVPSNFIEDTLKYFENNPKVGAVQAGHTATKGKNIFQDLMGMHLKSDSQFFGPARSKFGFCSLMGHGMTLSKKALQDIGFLPEVVLEDLGISLLLNENGYEIAYAPTIMCEEEYPSNYIIAKKRQLRWQEGAVEVNKKLKDVMHSNNLPFHIKRDIQIHLFQCYKLIYCVAISILAPTILALIGYDIGPYFSLINIGSLLVTAIPLLKDIFTYLPTKDFWKLPLYLILNGLVNSSYLPSMLIRITWAEFGKKPFFLVTAKGQHRVVALQIFLHSLLPITFVAIIAVMTYFAYGSLVPSLSMISAGILSPVFIILANVEYKEPKLKKVGAGAKKQAKVVGYSQDVTIES